MCLIYNFLLNIVVNWPVIYLIRIFLLRFFLIHTATQMETITQTTSRLTLVATTTIMKLFSDKPSG